MCYDAVSTQGPTLILVAIRAAFQMWWLSNGSQDVPVLAARAGEWVTSLQKTVCSCAYVKAVETIGWA